MNLEHYRQSELELRRTDDLMGLIADDGETALDVGARDGHFSMLLAERFRHVTAIDLVCPTIQHKKVHCIAGNASSLDFPDAAFELVFCAEVLEHIPVDELEQSCRELARVTAKNLLIGVPFRQDLRVGRTECQHCGARNPPWGHVSTFDLEKLVSLFNGLAVERTSYVGENLDVTNSVSTALLDFAGNPFGTYMQDEPCVHCGKQVGVPRQRSPLQRIATRAASVINAVQRKFASPRANWVHVIFRKP